MMPATTRAKAGPRFTPAEIADLLRLHRPTAEQESIIAAEVAPLLVVAGAGSGKTETMAARVVWLVANDYVRPEQILGLTFTRKAAGELASRVRLRLAQLQRKIEVAAGEPTIATYHSYAARIVAEHGVRAGYEPTARILSEAACWQIADAVVRSYDGDMSAVDKAPTTVVDAVMQLAGDLAEHLRTPDELAAWTGRFFASTGVLAGTVYAPVRDARAVQQARLALLPLVREYSRRKRDLEAMDFGDQLARAAHVAGTHYEVGAIERDRFRVVLLDEYQDTSHAQVSLLRALYGAGHPVTAVGDPCQSIYGWRGASAGTLDRFPEEFRRRDGDPATVLSLSTSWRNRPETLRVANRISEPLRAYGHRVTELVAAPDVAAATTSTVRCALTETFEDEAAWIADQMLDAWRAYAGDPVADPDRIPVDNRPTSAVLVRARSQIASIERALRSRGLPVEIVGLGGLLDTPEVRDVVSTMQVLADPLAGAALLRLLTGARWRIGPRDLVALHRRARSLLQMRREQAMDHTHGSASDGPEPITGSLDEAALIDALDDLGPEERYSAEGFRRFSVFADELRGLRRRLDQALPDLIEDIEREMGLAVEVSLRAVDTGLARAHLDAFADVAARFATDAPGATLSSFLAFLEAAESEERGLAAGETDVTDGAVQILTVHAAKGLEWDIVSVAGLVKDAFPGRATAADHYLGNFGVLPFPLRGDHSGLPYLDVDSPSDQKELRDSLITFNADWSAHHEREERRLAYVAMTRPRHLLLCSGYWWGEGIRPRGASAFLEDVRAVCAEGHGRVDAWEPPPAADATNPTLDAVVSAAWPDDPLGDRRAQMESAAALVRDGDGETLDDDETRRWAYETDLLLAERARSRPGNQIDVALPAQLSVSHLVAMRHDPAGLARRLRRPMPERPDVYARRGTAFHRWLEQRFGTDHLFDLDEVPGAGDDDAAPDEALAELQAIFLASEWANRTPIEVEVPFATSIAGVVIRGRMDAVFATPRGGFDVVDWKTGRRPGGRAARDAAVQLGAYRLAWAELAGVPVEQVTAAFYYVRDNATVRPADLVDRNGLIALVTGLPEHE
jgi:ATP-dependent DNA helicase UvrD/PcrA